MNGTRTRAETAATAQAAGRVGTVPGSRASGRAPVQVALRAASPALAVTVVLVVAVPSVLDAFWLKSFTAAVIYAIVALGAGLLYGRVGLVSLSQVALLGLGGWVGLRVGHGTGLPFALVLAISGLAAGVVGVVIGLPSLRFGGLYFALLTLMAAAAGEVVFQATQFPDGGGGFLGVAADASARNPLRRPAVAESDAAFFRYAVLVASGMFLVAWLHLRGRPGRAWAALRHDEAGAASTGVDVVRYKLWAIALASAMTGVAGALLAGSIGSLDVNLFRAAESIVLLAAVLVGGAFSLWGAVLAAAFVKLIPSLFDSWGLSGDLMLVLFGIGVLQVVATEPRGLAGAARRVVGIRPGRRHA